MKKKNSIAYLKRPTTAKTSSQLKVIKLNTKIGQKKLLSIFKLSYAGKKCEKDILCSYIFTKNKKKEEQIFDLNICRKKTKMYVRMTENRPNGFCLKMYFDQQRQHPKQKSYYSFKKSKIELINRGECGYANTKKSKIISGSFLLNVANHLNDLLYVDMSTLEDDSRLMICDSNVSIKIINLFKYGKTWYEREGGYKLDDKEIYKRIKIVGEMRVSELYNKLKEIDEDLLKSSITDITEKKINLEKIKKVSDLLEKIKMSKNSKIKNLIPKIFERNSPFKECEQKFLWDFILGLGSRAHIKKNPEQYKILTDYYKLQGDTYSFSNSSRKGKKII